TSSVAASIAVAGRPPLSARNLALFTHTATNAAPAKITPARRSFIPIILCFLVCAEFAPRSHRRAELFDCVTAPSALATCSVRFSVRCPELGRGAGRRQVQSHPRPSFRLQLDARLLRHLLSKIYNVFPPLRVYRRSFYIAPRQTNLAR